jgi:hypothetical protein
MSYINREPKLNMLKDGLLNPANDRLLIRVLHTKHFLKFIRHNRTMRMIHIVCFAMWLTSGLIWAGTPTQVRLRLGGHATLHVGQIAVLRLSSAHPFSVTLDGDAVVLVKADRSERMYSYQAVRMA